jgi:hypothetical protein
MAFYKVRVDRCCNTSKTVIVPAAKSQDAVIKTVFQLRSEGITDARAIKVIGLVRSLRG